jgi:DNA-directed RNA polymerase specialized sigma subunit
MGISSPIGTPDHQLNKRTSKKALKLLGVDPSQNKVAKTLGVDLKAAEEALISSSPVKPSETPPKERTSEGEEEEEKPKFSPHDLQSDSQKSLLSQIIQEMPKETRETLPHSTVPERLSTFNEGKR